MQFKVASNASPTFFNKNAALGLLLGFLVSLAIPAVPVFSIAAAVTSYLIPLAGAAVVGMLGGAIGKARMHREAIDGKVVKEPSMLNMKTAIGALAGLLIGAFLAVVATPMLLSVGAVAAVATASTIFVGGELLGVMLGTLIGGGIGKREMVRDYQNALHTQGPAQIEAARRAKQIELEGKAAALAAKQEGKTAALAAKREGKTATQEAKRNTTESAQMQTTRVETAPPAPQSATMPTPVNATPPAQQGVMSPHAQPIPSAAPSPMQPAAGPAPLRIQSTAAQLAEDRKQIAARKAENQEQTKSAAISGEKTPAGSKGSFTEQSDQQKITVTGEKNPDGTLITATSERSAPASLQSDNSTAKKANAAPMLSDNSGLATDMAMPTTPQDKRDGMIAADPKQTEGSTPADQQPKNQDKAAQDSRPISIHFTISMSHSQELAKNNNAITPDGISAKDGAAPAADPKQTATPVTMPEAKPITANDQPAPTAKDGNGTIINNIVLAAADIQKIPAAAQPEIKGATDGTTVPSASESQSSSAPALTDNDKSMADGGAAPATTPEDKSSAPDAQKGFDATAINNIVLAATTIDTVKDAGTPSAMDENPKAAAATTQTDSPKGEAASTEAAPAASETPQTTPAPTKYTAAFATDGTPAADQDQQPIAAPQTDSAQNTTVTDTASADAQSQQVPKEASIGGDSNTVINVDNTSQQPVDISKDVKQADDASTLRIAISNDSTLQPEQAESMNAAEPEDETKKSHAAAILAERKKQTALAASAGQPDKKSSEGRGDNGFAGVLANERLQPEVPGQVSV